MRGPGAEAAVEDLGALPGPFAPLRAGPQDLPLYSHRSPCYNPAATEEDRAPVGTDPFGFAQGRPERLSGAAAAGDDRSTRSSPLGFLGRLRRLESGKSQGVWGTGPPDLPPQHLGGTHKEPGRA